MKLGAGYNTFSGLELLKPSILSIRNVVDVVVVVYSLKSITGEPCAPYMMDLLQSLKHESLVDYLLPIEHVNLDSPLEIQKQKRMKYEMGRKKCKLLGCTHYMGRDCDEFFDTDQLVKALATFENAGVVVCPVYDYVAKPTLRSKVGRLHVPAFQQIDCEYKSFRYPVLVDMSRTVPSSDVIVVKEDTLVMHHMTGVRYDRQELMIKFVGHSHFHKRGEGCRPAFISAWTNPPKGIYRTVPDRFGIEAYWDGEFKQWIGRDRNEPSKI